MSRNYFAEITQGFEWGQKQFVDRPRLLQENAENRSHLQAQRGNELQDRQNARSATDQLVSDKQEFNNQDAAAKKEHTHALMRQMKESMFGDADPLASKTKVMEVLNDPEFQSLRDKFTGGKPIINGGLGEDGRVGLVFDRGDGQTTGFSVPYDDFADTILEYSMNLDPEYARQLGAEDNAPSPGLGDAQQAPPSVSDPALVARESSGRLDAQNDEVGHGGQRGHFGRVQFGHGRLQDAKDAGVLPQDMTPEQFMASAELQDKAEAWHFGDIDAFVQQQGLDRHVGTEIAGVPVTAQGMRNVANLGGKEGMRKFLESGGEYNPPDANGTRLSDYLELGAKSESESQERPGLGARALDAVISPAGADQAGMGLENANSGTFGEPEGGMAPSSLLQGNQDTAQGLRGDLAQHRRETNAPDGFGNMLDRQPMTEGQPLELDKKLGDAWKSTGLGQEQGFGGPPEAPSAEPEAPSAEPETPPATPRAERQGLMAGLGVSDADMAQLRLDRSGQRSGGGGNKRPSNESIAAAGEFLFQGKIGLEDFQNYARTGSFGKPAARQAAMNMGKEGGYVFDPNTNTSRWVGPEGGPSKPTIKWSDIGARDKELSRIMGYESSSDFGFLREKGMWDVTLAASGQTWQEWFSSEGGESAFRQVNTASRAIERGGRKWWHKLPFTGVEDKHFSRTLAVQLVTSGMAAGGSDREQYEAAEALQDKYWRPLQTTFEASGRGGQLTAHQASVFTQGMIEMEHALGRGPGAVQEVLTMLQSPEVDWNADRMQEQLIRMRDGTPAR